MFCSWCPKDVSAKLHSLHAVCAPAIHLVYSFSHIDEVNLIAPLLPFQHNGIKITLHYTGETQLTDVVFPGQAPLQPLKSPTSPLDEGDNGVPPPPLTSLGLVHGVTSRWQLLIVWLLTAFACFWCIVRFTHTSVSYAWPVSKTASLSVVYVGQCFVGMANA